MVVGVGHEVARQLAAVPERAVQGGRFVAAAGLARCLDRGGVHPQVLGELMGGRRPPEQLGHAGFMYPEVRKLLPDLENEILESYAEHHVADALCVELYAMSPEAERFDAKVAVLVENVTRHMDEEEQEWFPKVRKGLSRTTLQEIGARMVELKKTAPRSPAQPSALRKAVDAIIA